MASSIARAQCSLDAVAIADLLKSKVQSIDDMKYTSVEPEELVANYVEFLMAAARFTDRLNEKVVKDATAQVFAVAKPARDLFAKQIIVAFQYCKAKGSQSTTGKKLSDPVRQVVTVMQKRGTSPLKPQAAARKAGPCAHGPLMQSHLDEQGAETERVARVGAASAVHGAASGHADGSSIMAIYGFEVAPSSSAAAASSAEVEIYSSQEVLASQEPPPVCIEELSDEEAAEPPMKRAKGWTDMSSMQFTLRAEGGRMSKVDLEQGPDGFAIARLPGGIHKTEVPNLLVEQYHAPKATMKKPAAALKKPAAVLKKPAAAKAVLRKPAAADMEEADPEDEDFEQEEEEEEEKDEEEEEEEEEE